MTKHTFKKSKYNSKKVKSHKQYIGKTCSSIKNTKKTKKRLPKQYGGTDNNNGSIVFESHITNIIWVDFSCISIPHEKICANIDTLFTKEYISETLTTCLLELYKKGTLVYFFDIVEYPNTISDKTKHTYLNNLASRLKQTNKKNGIVKYNEIMKNYPELNLLLNGRFRTSHKQYFMWPKDKLTDYMKLLSSRNNLKFTILHRKYRIVRKLSTLSTEFAKIYYIDKDELNKQHLHHILAHINIKSQPSYNNIPMDANNVSSVDNVSGVDNVFKFKYNNDTRNTALQLAQPPPHRLPTPKKSLRPVPPPPNSQPAPLNHPSQKSSLLSRMLRKIRKTRKKAP